MFRSSLISHFLYSSLRRAEGTLGDGLLRLEVDILLLFLFVDVSRPSLLLLRWLSLLLLFECLELEVSFF